MRRGSHAMLAASCRTGASRACRAGGIANGKHHGCEGHQGQAAARAVGRREADSAGGAVLRGPRAQAAVARRRTRPARGAAPDDAAAGRHRARVAGEAATVLAQRCGAGDARGDRAHRDRGCAVLRARQAEGRRAVQRVSHRGAAGAAGRTHRHGHHARAPDEARRAGPDDLHTGVTQGTDVRRAAPRRAPALRAPVLGQDRAR